MIGNLLITTFKKLPTNRPINDQKNVVDKSLLRVEKKVSKKSKKKKLCYPPITVPILNIGK